MTKSKKTYKELALEFKRTRSDRSFTELYEKMKPGLWNYVNGILKDPEITDDVVSTTLTTVYLKIDQYNDDYQITTWAYRIAYNECIGQLRARNKKISMNVFTDKGVEATDGNTLSFDSPLIYEADGDVESEHLERERIITEKLRLTTEAIKALPPLYKPYMIERFLNGKSYNDIYEMMSDKERGISLQTVKNRIFRGRKIIQQQLSKMDVFVEAV
jgi:RNA polymerase sigma-70 factor (ECF subfamily)